MVLLHGAFIFTVDYQGKAVYSYAELLQFSIPLFPELMKFLVATNNLYMAELLKNTSDNLARSRFFSYTLVKGAVCYILFILIYFYSRPIQNQSCCCGDLFYRFSFHCAASCVQLVLEVIDLTHEHFPEFVCLSFGG